MTGYSEALLLAAAGGEIERVIACAYEHTGLPITLVDNAYNLIAHCGTARLPGPPERPADEDRQARRAWFETMKTADGPVIDESSGNPFRALCTDVVFRGIRLAKLSFFETRPFTEEDKRSLTLLAAALSGLMWDRTGLCGSPENIWSAYLLALLTGQMTGAAYEEILSLPGSGQVASWTLAAILIGGSDLPDSSQTEYLAQGLPLCLCTVYDGCLAMLVPSAHLDSLTADLGHIQAVMGSSRPFSAITEAAAYWPQARYALTCASAANLDQCRYPALFLTEAARLLTGLPGGPERMRPELRVLKAYDSVHETALYETLRTYVRQNGSMAETAKALYVHYNTIKYRLRMIRDITGLNEIDARTAAELLLSFEMDEKIVR